MALFFGAKAKCAACHGGAEFTNASVRSVKKQPLSRMVMGNGGTAVYDEGFYNISITKTLEDIANGGKNPVSRPLALTALAQQVSAKEFEKLIGIPPNVSVAANERIAVNGAFKTPGIRNIELTAPYFHNGDSLTLEHIVEFYNRGGNHFNNNRADLDADIQPLGLTDTERAQLVAFLKALTDERVRYKRAPFDHPQLFIVNGHATDANGFLVYDGGRAKDVVITLPEVGRAGVNVAPANFLERRSLVAAAGPRSVACATEGQTCQLQPGKTATVWYGAGNAWIELQGRTGSLICSSSTFAGDPMMGVAKTCRQQ